MAKVNHSQKSEAADPRVLLAFFLPLAGALLFSAVARGMNTVGLQAPVFGGLGITSWLLGLRWYGLSGMGLRGKRPLFAGIGFAVLGWIAFLLFRFLFVRIASIENAGGGFMYLLIFEAFALQLWTFGIFFHAVADWRGPLTAAVASGILFGAVALLLFQEAFIGSWDAVIYFVVWGVLYGMIRLRTGSILGMVIIQTWQTFTGWLVLLPFLPPDVAELRPFYLLTTAAYLIFIWRLWPKVEEDYRV